MPRNVTELIAQIDRAGAFIGNDSGPGHLAAICGVPTFTLFGPQLPEWFAPLHPAFGMDGRQALSLQAVFGLLPVRHAVLSVEHRRGRSFCPRRKISRRTNAKSFVKISFANAERHLPFVISS